MYSLSLLKLIGIYIMHFTWILFSYFVMEILSIFIYFYYHAFHLTVIIIKQCYIYYVFIIFIRINLYLLSCILFGFYFLFCYGDFVNIYLLCIYYQIFQMDFI